jgi:hypothetical protein
MGLGFRLANTPDTKLRSKGEESWATDGEVRDAHTQVAACGSHRGVGGVAEAVSEPAPSIAVWSVSGYGLP